MRDDGAARGIPSRDAAFARRRGMARAFILNKGAFSRVIGVCSHTPSASSSRYPWSRMSHSRFTSIRSWSIALLVACGAIHGASANAQPTRARAAYDTVAATDPILRLQARLDAGTITLPHDSARGYLPALLEALAIPVSSQGLVFSRTSLRTDLIAPWSPRALYFNDDVYVGFVQGSEFLEIATVNPDKGAVFYTLTQELAARPTFAREGNTCLMCHKSPVTGGVPGFMVLSTIADHLGYQITGAHDGATTDHTPIKDRFGGWYVTGTHGPAGHSGNVYSPKNFNQVNKDDYRAQIDLTTESERTNLTGKFDTSPYLSPHSDIVALMVLVHQTSVHNLITTAHQAASTALIEAATLDRYRADSVRNRPLAEVNGTLHMAVERLVRAMLFIDEAPFGASMHGTSTFTEDFARTGPRDAKGRSLRELDLHTRLFRYPMSFLVYSEQFDALPAVAKDAVYARFRAILGGRDTSPEFQRLSARDRTAALEILMATKPDFAATFLKK
jgi:hypothetical protein